MTGVKYVVPGVDFANYLDIADYPIDADLSALFFTRADAATALKNRAANGIDATAVGASVAFSAGYATFSGDPLAAANYIQTAESDDASTNWTRIAMFQKMDTTDRPVFGQFHNVVSGSVLLQTGPGYGTGSAYVTGAFKGNPAFPKFEFLAASYQGGAGGTLKTYSAANGVLAAAVTTTGAARAPEPSSAPERIGGAVSNSAFNGTSRIALVAKHRSVISDADIAVIYAFCRFEAARVGIALN